MGSIAGQKNIRIFSGDGAKGYKQGKMLRDIMELFKNWCTYRKILSFFFFVLNQFAKFFYIK
jgi:hypothetical protein